MDKQKTISKKRGTIATKIIIVVALAVIITNTICKLFNVLWHH